MSNPIFWRLLGLTTVVSGITLALLHFFIPSLDAVNFSLSAVVLFIILSVMAYYLGKRGATSTNKYRFVHIIVFFILLKMVASIVLIVGYIKLAEPTGKVFIVPFLVVYLFYTIFEVYFLEKIARLKPATKSSPL